MKKTKHIWPSLALGAVVMISMALSSAVFSQGGYPPPFSLIAETQAVGSGQIKLSWQKPSSSGVIGYNIYRDGSQIDNVIGANTLSYFDGNLSPSNVFNYFVKAVYLGVAEADLPASNEVEGVSPAYCTGTCVQNNPFTAGAGRTIVDLKGKKLDAKRKQSETFTVNLPAGRYQVYAHSFDAYDDRADDAQDNERWFLVLQSSGSEVARTNATADLLDGRDEVGSTQVIETELILTSSVNQTKAVHSGVNGGNFDDIGTSAVMFVNMDDPTVQANNCLLVIDKTADKDIVASGELITYTITVRNDGGANCTGGGNYIFDVLPPQVSFVSETHTPNMHIPYSSAYLSDGHYVWVVATSPLVPDEVAIVNITVQVDEDIPVDSCDGDSDPGPGGGGSDDIINQVYVTNNQYSDRAIEVYSNSVATLCDAEPEPEPEIDATVVPSPNPSYPGGEVTWTATPFGECPGPFSYSWTGDDGLIGSNASVNHVYDSSGNYNATVTVTAPNCTPLTKQSPTPAMINPRTLSGITCEPSPKTAAVNQEVSWTAVPNPDGDYDYTWSGDNGLSGNTKTVKKSYSSPGIYRAKVDVDSVGNSHCESTVNVKINPNFQEI